MRRAKNGSPSGALRTEFFFCGPPVRDDCLAEDAVSCEPISGLTGKLTGNFAESDPACDFRARSNCGFNSLQRNSLPNETGNFQMNNREYFHWNRETYP